MRTVNRRRGGGALPGFTLIELMVVVSIIGVLAALAVVGLTRTSAPRDVQRATSFLVAELNQARALAMESGNPVRFVVQRTDDFVSLVQIIEDIPGPGDPGVRPSCRAFDAANPDETGVSRTWVLNPVDRGAVTDLEPGFGDATVVGQTPLRVVFDFVGPDTDGAPEDAGESLHLCFLPSGRVTGTGGLPLMRPPGFPADAAGGRAYLEIAAADCDAGESDLSCNVLVGVRTVVLVESNGRVERMPAGYSVARGLGGDGGGDGDGDGDGDGGG